MIDSKQSKVFEEDRHSQVPIEEEFAIEKVICEICTEIIGKCDMSKFAAPMTGDMFIPKDHKHGYPAPFILNENWRDLRCPVCKFRPFESPNYFYNEKDEKCGWTDICPDCGQGFKNYLALSGHRKHCRRK